MSKKFRFTGLFDKQHGKGAQALLNSASHHFYHILWSLPRKWSWKKSLLLIWEIFGLLVNTLDADENFPVPNRDNLTIPIQMQLSQTKNFSQFLASFFKSRFNFEHFGTKDDPDSFCISEITYCENVVRKMSKKSRSRGRFHKQHGKHGRARFTSASHGLYHIHRSLSSQLS